MCDNALGVPQNYVPAPMWCSSREMAEAQGMTREWKSKKER